MSTASLPQRIISLKLFREALFTSFYWHGQLINARLKVKLQLWFVTIHEQELLQLCQGHVRVPRWRTSIAQGSSSKESWTRWGRRHEDEGLVFFRLNDRSVYSQPADALIIISTGVVLPHLILSQALFCEPYQTVFPGKSCIIKNMWPRTLPTVPIKVGSKCFRQEAH